MSSISLTPRTVSAVPVDPSADVLVWDADEPGFGLKVTPKGRRVFLYQYWSPVERGKRRRFTLGELGASYTHPDGRTVQLTPHAARTIVEALKGDVRSGRDPFLDKKDRAAHQLAEQARRARDQRERQEADAREAAGRQTFTDAAMAFLESCRERMADDELSPSTVREWERLLLVHILPVLGRRQVRALGATDAADMKRAMGSKRKIQANRAQQLCRRILNTVPRDGAPNPFSLGERKANQWYRERETRQPVTSDELGALFAVLDADDPDTRGGAHDAIRLLALTGWRKQEVLSLRWDAIDLDSGEVRLARTKTGASDRSLTPSAIALLSRIPRRGAFVFPSPENPAQPRVEIKRVWLRMREAAGIAKPLHALRHGFASVAISEGIPLAHVGALLGHRDAKTTLRYAKVEQQARRAAAATVGRALDSATTPTAVRSISSRRNA